MEEKNDKTADGPKKTVAGKNFRTSSKKWRAGSFFMQLATVVIGILITFQGSAWVERNSQRNQMKKILENVVSEMNTNLIRMEYDSRQVKRELAAAEFFSRHINDLRGAPADSVDIHIRGLENNMRFFVISDALEVLKASATSVKVIDKELLQDIFALYNSTELLYYNLNHYFGDKGKLLAEFYASNDIDITRNARENPYTYIGKYYGTPATRNFLFMTQFLLKPNLSGLEMIVEEYGKTIEIINEYISGNLKSRTK